MSKYIPADKLIAEIEDRLHCNGAFDEVGDYAWHYDQGMIDAYKHIKEFIASLQQEQPMPDSTKLIELWHEDKEMLKEKDFRDDPWRLAYNAFMCGFCRGLAVKQEQPEVDLEKEIEEQINIYYNECEKKLNQMSDDDTDIGFLTLNNFARHFYELGLKAKKK